MDTELIIRCVGLEGLTITVSGADHSIPIITEVLRVTYNTADLKGNLTISDDSGRPLYRWSSDTTAQPPPAEPRQPGSQLTCNHEKQRHSPSISAPPSYQTAGTPRTTHSSRAHNELDNRQNASSDAEAMAENSDGPRQRRSRNGRQATYLESSLSRSATYSTANRSTSSSPVRRLKSKSNRKPKEKSQVSEDRDSELSGLYLLLARKRRFRSRSKVATPSDSDSGPLESDVAPPRKQRCKRRERIRLEDSSDKGSETPMSDMTRTQKNYLRDLLDPLSRENNKDSEPFAKPVDPIAEEIPTYHTVIKRPMDLLTLKENLGKGFYPSVKVFGADFNLMIENSIRFNGMMHEVSQRGLRLLNAFNALMAGRK